LVIDRFPESRYAERSLVRQINAYIQFAENSVPARQEERFQKAVESYEKYLQLFPRGDNRSRAEDLYDRAREALVEIRGDDGDESEVAASS
jgi:outer membrane protein assembly factor BamD